MEDQTELFRKLARGIKPAIAVNKATSPIAANFFADDPVGLLHLNTDTLLSDLPGILYNERLDMTTDAAAAANQRSQAFADAMHAQYPNAAAMATLKRPRSSGDVSQIGLGVGSGWTAPKPSVSSSAKAAGLAAALRKNRAAKGIATTVNADTGILTALLAEIVKSLLGGVDPSSLDSATVKSRFATALRKASSETIATVKEITDALQEAKAQEAFASRGGTWRREGSRLSLSI